MFHHLLHDYKPNQNLIISLLHKNVYDQKKKGVSYYANTQGYVVDLNRIILLLSKQLNSSKRVTKSRM